MILDDIAYNKFANGEITLGEYIKYLNRDKIMNYEQKYKAALGWMQSLYKGLHGATKEDAEHYFPELAESEDEKIRKAIYNALKYLELELSWDFLDEVDILDAYAWLEKQGEQKQTWKPSAAQLIVIKSLIENKNTSNVDKTILRGMLDEFKQYFGL